MTTLDALQQWCTEARKLLKTTTLRVSTTDTKVLRARLEKVDELIRELAGERDSDTLYQECVRDYATLKDELRQQAKQFENAKDKEKNAKQRELSEKFGALQEKLQRGVTEARGKRKVLVQLSEARGAYMTDYRQALQQIELLAVTPKGNPANVRRELVTINDHAAQDTVEAYAKARNDLKVLTPKIKDAFSSAERMLQAELKQFEARPVVTRQLELAEKRFAEIEPLVGIESTLARFRAVLAEARKLAAQDNWTAAANELSKLGDLPDSKACVQDSATQRKSLREIQAYTEGERHLDRLAELLPREAVAELRKTFTQAANALVNQQFKGDALRTLQNVAAHLGSEKLRFEELGAGCHALSLKLTTLTDEMRQVSSPMSVLGPQSDFDNFVALLEGKRLDMAMKLGNQLQQTLEALVPARQKEQQSWARQRSVAISIQQKLTALRSSPCTTVALRAAQALTYLAPTDIQHLEQEREFARLVENMEKARRQLAELNQLNRDFGGIDALRDTASQAVTKQAKGLEPTLDKLDKAAAEAMRKAGAELFDATKKFRGEIQLVRTDWEAAAGSATSPDALNAAHDAALRRLDVIGADIAAATNEKGIAQLLELRKREQAEPVFKKNWQTFESLLREVRDLDTTAAEKMAQRGNLLRDVAAMNWHVAVTKLSLLIAEARSARRIGEQEKTKEHDDCTRLLKQALDEINRVKNTSRKNAGAFAEAFKAMETERTELGQLAASDNLDALREVKRGLQALIERAAKYAPQSAGGIGDSTSMLGVVNGIQHARESLKSARDALKADNPRGLIQLAERFATLKVDVYKVDPELGLQKIDEFMKALLEGKANAQKVAAVRRSWSDLLPNVKNALSSFKSRNVAHEYSAALVARLEEAEKLAETPSRLFEGLTKLQRIEEELKAATLDLHVAMGKEQEILGQRHRDEATRHEYKVSLDVCQKRYAKDAQSAVASAGGDKALLIELERMVTVAKQSAKNGDHGKALQQVRLTIERARQITADPYGPAIGSRNALPKDQQVYREAVAAFEAMLDEVKTITLLAVPGADEKVKKKLRDDITRLATKLDRNEFEAVLRDLQREKITDSERRTLREAALAKVRKVQGVLEGNPQIRLLLTNPAAKDKASLGIRRVTSALTRLEANISRSVR